MRPVTATRHAFALSLALVATFGSPQLQAGAAPAGRFLLPDGTVRYDFGRRPMPVLNCKPHYVCDIMLDSGESVLNMAIGDSAHWIIAGGQSGASGTTPHVFIKPTQPLLDTNLVITTTKRVYNVSLRSANDARDSRISFFYADEDAAANAGIAARQRTAIDSVLAGTPERGADQADAKYKIAGDSSLVPDKVFNDGARTFIEWKTLPIELPKLVAIAKDGSAQTANFRVVGSAYIVDNTNPSYDLVIGAGPDRPGRPERRASIRHL